MRTRVILLSLSLVLPTLFACSGTGGTGGSGGSGGIAGGGGAGGSGGAGGAGGEGGAGGAGGAGGTGGVGGAGGTGGAGGVGGTGGTGGLPLVETNCHDGKDDDKDGEIDCADSDCKSATHIDPACISELACKGSVDDPNALDCCKDGKDNDHDGFTDCSDIACANTPACPETDCGDKVDNDGDGFIDCLDSDCFNQPACQREICNDQIDNNDDGNIDCADPECSQTPFCLPEDCFNGKDDNGDALVDCQDPKCATLPNCADESQHCSDGLDQDNNGLVDCADPACVGNAVCVFNPGTLVITEMMIEPKGTGPDGFDPDVGAEWVELYNPGKADVNLQGFKVANETVSFTFKDKMVVTAGSFFILASATPPGTNVDLGIKADATYGSDLLLANDGGTFSITDPSGTLIDKVDYHDDIFKALLAKGEGRSLSLDKTHATADDNDKPESWQLASTAGSSYTRTDVGGSNILHFASPRKLLQQCPDEICDNGKDDDCDGFTDCADSDCADVSCGANGQYCDFSVSMCVCPGGEQFETTCNDGVDNDCDGSVDCADSDCSGFDGCP